MLAADYDPVVLTHARALLTSREAGATSYIGADLRDPGTILTQAAELLDFTKPVALTLIAILHAIPDSDDPHTIVAKLLDAVSSGSYIAVSHMGKEFVGSQTRQDIKGIENRMSRESYTSRSHEQVARFFEGTDLVTPGLVRLEEWRPEPGTPGPGRSSLWGAVGRCPIRTFLPRGLSLPRSSPRSWVKNVAITTFSARDHGILREEGRCGEAVRFRRCHWG